MTCCHRLFSPDISSPLLAHGSIHYLPANIDPTPPQQPSRYRFSSCANVFALRCICWTRSRVSVLLLNVDRTVWPSLLLHLLGRSCSVEAFSYDENTGGPYRIVLPVRRRIHCGIGRFCFWAFASFCFVRKDLWDCISLVRYFWGRKGHESPAYRHRDGLRCGGWLSLERW